MLRVSFPWILQAKGLVSVDLINLRVVLLGILDSCFGLNLHQSVTIALFILYNIFATIWMHDGVEVSSLVCQSVGWGSNRHQGRNLC